MKTFRLLFLMLAILSASIDGAAQSPFVVVRDGQFFRGNTPYRFMGTNFWYGMNIGMEKASGDRRRLVRELDRLQAMGVTNLRILGLSEGPDTEPYRVTPSAQPKPGEWNEETLRGLDFLLVEMGKRNMTAVVVLGNFWPWSGGFGQYLVWSGKEGIPYPPPHPGGDWNRYMLFASGFYSCDICVNQYLQAIRTLIGRTNTLTGKPYRDDPTIMSWQLANEPRGILSGKAYRQWIETSARVIKSIAPNHLVSIGSEGLTPSRLAGNRFKRDHRIKNIDYTTAHVWVQNWGWYNPEKPDETLASATEKAREYIRNHARMSKAIGMPFVLEEFGISRDANSHVPNAPVSVRDKYYSAVFEEITQLSSQGKASGVNFWAWGGEARPPRPEGIWRHGDPLVGDPPHETQGWYSVYDTDASTIDIIRNYAGRIAYQLRAE